MTMVNEEKALIISGLRHLGTLAEILRTVQSQGTVMEQRVAHSRARTRKEKSMPGHYAPIELNRFLGALAHILGYDGAAGCLPSEDREIVRPLIEDLVARGQMGPERLNGFRTRKSPS